MQRIIAHQYVGSEIGCEYNQSVAEIDLVALAVGQETFI